MKKLLSLTALLLSVNGIASAATIQVTMSFSSTTSYLSNFANGAGTSVVPPLVAPALASNRMVWGLLIDVSGNGFSGAGATSPLRGGFSLAANANGLVTTTTTNGSDSVASDDILVINSSVMAVNTTATPPDSSLTNMNRVLGFGSLNLTDSMQGKPMALIWFDTVTIGSTASNGMKYGVFNLGLNTPTVAGNPSFASNFSGADSLKTMDFTLGTPIPETSTSLLGAIGALALLRRRRN
jgi:hypothetical protein